MIRPMTTKDIAAVRRIFFDSYAGEQCEEAFQHFARNRESIWTVITYRGRVVGYSCHTVSSDAITLAIVNTDRKHRGKGYARTLVEDLQDQLAVDCRTIKCAINESNTTAVRFLLQMRFVCVKVAAQGFETIGEDVYFMEYKLPDEVHSEKVVNRIKRWVK